MPSKGIRAIVECTQFQSTWSSKLLHTTYSLFVKYKKCASKILMLIIHIIIYLPHIFVPFKADLIYIISRGRLASWVIGQNPKGPFNSLGPPFCRDLSKEANIFWSGIEDESSISLLIYQKEKWFVNTPIVSFHLCCKKGIPLNTFSGDCAPDSHQTSLPRP